MPRRGAFTRTPASMSNSATMDGDRAVAHVAVARDQPDLRILDLRLAGVAAELPSQFDDMVQPHDVALTQEPAMSVDRQHAAQRNAAVHDERPALAFLAETQQLELVDYREGEAVVDLGNIDIRRTDA